MIDRDDSESTKNMIVMIPSSLNIAKGTSPEKMDGLVCGSPIDYK